MKGDRDHITQAVATLREWERRAHRGTVTLDPEEISDLADLLSTSPASEGGRATLIGPDGFTRLAETIANDAALVRMSQAEGWDAAVQEAEDRGLLCDAFADEIWGRNPYRDSSSNRSTPDTPADAGVCARPGCGHSRSRHGNLGCLVERGDSGSGSVADAVFCRCIAYLTTPGVTDGE